MPNSPGDKVRRQDQSDDSPTEIEFMFDEDMEAGLVHPQEVPTGQVVIERWRVSMALSYLLLTTVLCLTAIVIKPSSEVQSVALAVWASASAAGGLILRRAVRRR